MNFEKTSLNNDDMSILTYAETTEGLGRYSREILIEKSKIKEVEKQGQITLREGQDIKTTFMSKFLARENILYLGKFTEEQPITIEEATGKLMLPLITEEEIEKRINKIPKKHREKIGTISLSTIQILVKSTYLKGIESPITLVVVDNRIKDNQDKIIGVIQGNLKFTAVKFNVSLRYGIPLVSDYLSNSVGILFNFHRKEVMNKDDYPFTITFAVGYALSNSAHSVQFADREQIYIEELFAQTSTKLKVLKQPQILQRNLSTQSKKFNLKDKKLLEIEPKTEIPKNESLNKFIEPKTETSRETNQRSTGLKTLETQIQSLQQIVNNIDRKI